MGSVQSAPTGNPHTTPQTARAERWRAFEVPDGINLPNKMKTETTLNARGQEWANLDLSRGYEQDKCILDPYTFGTLLLEIHCGTKTINAATVRAQFEECLQSKIESAREVFEANLQSIIREAKRDRNQA